MEIEDRPTSTRVDSFVPYLSNWFINVSNPTIPRKEEKGFPIGTSCTGITSFIGNIFTYVNSGYADIVYATLPAELQPYKPYFVLSDINSVLKVTRELSFQAFNLKTSGESVIRQLYRFSQNYAVKLHIGQAPSCGIHHFTLYRNKILSTWGENFYIYYSESETTEDEFVFYATYDGNPAYINAYQGIAQKYIFPIDKFNFIGGESIIENKTLPLIYYSLLEDIINEFHKADDESDEYDEIEEDKGLRILQKYITATPDEPQDDIIEDRMSEAEDLNESDELTADSYIKRVISAVLLSQDVSIEEINRCLFDYQEGIEDDKYNTYWLNKKGNLYRAREEYFKTPTEENEFYKYYKSELDKITPNGRNNISVWCSLSSNATDTSLSTEAKRYNQTAWEAMAPFVPNNKVTIGTPMTRYGYYYNNILANVNPEHNEYTNLRSAGKTDTEIIARLQESYAAMKLDEHEIVPIIPTSSCSCILEKNVETGKYKYVPKQAPSPRRTTTRSMNKSTHQEVPEGKSRKLSGGKGRTRKTKTKKHRLRKTKSTRKHKRSKRYHR